MNIRVSRVSFLSKAQIEEPVPSPLVLAQARLKYIDETNHKKLCWHAYFLCPVDMKQKEKTMEETNKFLTTGQGYKIGMIIEGDVNLEQDFVQEDEAQIREKIENIVSKTLNTIDKRIVLGKETTIDENELV